MYKRVAIDSALSDDNGEIDVRHRDGWPSTSGSNSTAPFTTVSRGTVVDKRVGVNSALGDDVKAMFGTSASKRLSAAQRGWPARE